MASMGLKKELELTYDEALTRVPEALKTEGFGVLTEVDMSATLKAKLGVDFRRYKILGACNPPLAHRALSADLEVGLMMPCNVIVFERDGGKATVAAVDPLKTMAMQGGAEVQAVAGEVRAKLVRALERLS
jgi:uncharacterized protein (DUF302 family)